MKDALLRLTSAGYNVMSHPVLKGRDDVMRMKRSHELNK